MQVLKKTLLFDSIFMQFLEKIQINVKIRQKTQGKRVIRCKKCGGVFGENTR